MKLSALLDYKNIVIQCHDNPDADAICSGYVLYKYLKSHGIKARFIYSGNFKISKSNLVYLINSLDIPIEYVSKLSSKPELLVMTDCQYGEGNVRKFAAKNVAVIDHHQVSATLPKLNEVRSNIGSCCTVIWNLLKIENEDKVIDKKVSTALYYGLYSDTNALSEIGHPLDRDMVDALDYDKSLILKLKNMNMTLREARIAGVALLNVDYHQDFNYAVLKSEPCDPNILGIIGDLIVAVDTIDICIVYSILPFGVKFSVRSCVSDTRADELAAFLSNKIGSGGGHTDKAGGILDYELLKIKFPDLTDIEGEFENYSIKKIISDRLNDYFENSDIIHARNAILDTKSMSRYVKSSVVVGYVKPQKFFKSGGMAILRTIKGDTNIDIKANTVLIIELDGSVRAISEEKFKSSYTETGDMYKPDLDYVPIIKNADNGKSYSLLPHAKGCISTGEINIYAKKLKKTTKLFPYWDPDNYMLGLKGDYIAVSKDDPKNIFIVEKAIFKQTYKKRND